MTPPSFRAAIDARPPPHGPTPVYGAKEYYRGDRTSYTNEEDKDATPEPADLVKKLKKATQAGCKWLLEPLG